MANDNGSSLRKRLGVGTLAVALAVAIGAIVMMWIFRPPQMGADEDAAKTVDALFTAITARDEKLLGDCEKRLRAHHEAGKLPKAVSAHLDGIIATARAGRWQPAAERLYAFMAAQRRDAAPH